MTKTIVYKHERVKLLKEAIKNGDISGLLFFDLETALMTVYTHYIGNKVSIYHNQIKEDKKIITIQYMFEGDRGPQYLEWDWTGKTGGDDSSMIEEFITNILNQPDIIVVGQNHKSFDHKVLNDRAKVLRLTPPEDVMKVDTLTLSRGAFRSASHKLDFRSKQLGLGGKNPMEFQDWVDINNGDRKALKKMIKYGLKDVTDLRSIFWLELPYYETLPAKLNKILLDLKKSKAKVPPAMCMKCRRSRRPSKNIMKIKGVLTCKNCGLADHVEAI